MARYRRKAARVDAVLWTGGNVDEVQEFFSDDPADDGDPPRPGKPIEMSRRDGRRVEARPGDWIVREHRDYEKYAADEFAAAFEPVGG